MLFPLGLTEPSPPHSCTFPPISGFSSLPVYLPSIIAQFGFSPSDAQGLTAPPYFLAFLMVIFSTYISVKTQQRGLVIATLRLIGAIGYIVLATTRSVVARYRRLPRRCRCLPIYHQGLTLVSQQSGLRYQTRSRDRRAQRHRSMFAFTRHEIVSRQ